jgi:DnaK suppressor protein
MLGVDEKSVRARLEELQTTLLRRQVRDPRSARSSANRGRLTASLEDVDRAIRMLDKGTYGFCEACGEPIPPDRLEANPAARFCLKDQQRDER